MGLMFQNLANDELKENKEELARKFPVPQEIIRFHMLSESLNYLLKSRESIHVLIMDNASELPDDYIHAVLKQVHDSTVLCVENLINEFFGIRKTKLIKKPKKTKPRGKPKKRKNNEPQ